MDAMTIAIVAPPVLMAVGMTVVGAVAWGKLTARFDGVDKTQKELKSELHTSNGATTFVSKMECSTTAEGIGKDVANLGKKMDAMDRKRDDAIQLQDEKWTMIIKHMGAVEQFMKQSS